MVPAKLQLRFSIPVALLLLTPALFGQSEFRAPETVAQGQALRIEASSGATATWSGQSIRLYPQSNGALLGLLSIPATQTPGEQTLEIRDGKDALLHRHRFTVLDARFPRQNISASTSMKTLTPLPGEMETMREFNKSESERRFWQEPFLRPTSECANSPFGVQRLHNGKPTGGYHRGLDLRSPKGTPVHAANDGVVKVARMFRYHGGTVGIDHGQGIITHYLHLSQIVAKEGQPVKKGDVVGLVGATGFATGPHLHWGLYIHGVPVNPNQWSPGIGACRAR